MTTHSFLAPTEGRTHISTERGAKNNKLYLPHYKMHYKKEKKQNNSKVLLKLVKRQKNAIFNIRLWWDERTNHCCQIRLCRFRSIHGTNSYTRLPTRHQKHALNLFTPAIGGGPPPIRYIRDNITTTNEKYTTGIQEFLIWARYFTTLLLYKLLCTSFERPSTFKNLSLNLFGNGGGAI